MGGNGFAGYTCSTYLDLAALFQWSYGGNGDDYENLSISVEVSLKQIRTKRIRNVPWK